MLRHGHGHAMAFTVHEEFRDKYVRARDSGRYHRRRNLDIADDGSKRLDGDRTRGSSITRLSNGRASELMPGKWLAGKLRPKVLGKGRDDARTR